MLEDLCDSGDAEQEDPVERAISSGGKDDPAAIARAKVRYESFSGVGHQRSVGLTCP